MSHLATRYFAERGLQLEATWKYGVEVDCPPNRERIIARLGEDRLINGAVLSQAAQEILWIPRTNKDGAIVARAARALPTPSDGTRFLDPVGSDGTPLILLSTYELQNKVNVPIIISEGATRIYLADQVGFAAIGLNGVWGATIGKADPPYTLRPELAVFEWVGRKVYLAFDADWQSNPQVRHALLRLAFLLHVVGAGVYQLSWPLSEGKGLDDYLATKAGLDIEKQKAIFAELTNQAEPFAEKVLPHDLEFVKAELDRVQMGRAHRNQLAKLLARPLKVSVSVLDAKAQPTQTTQTQTQTNLRPYQEILEPWPEAVDGRKLFDGLCKELARFVTCEPYELVAVGAWIFQTYLVDSVSTLPILRAVSPTEACGKSRLVDAVGLFAYRPKKWVAPSPAAFFRVRDGFDGSLLCDECEGIDRENYFRSIINGTFERGVSVPRVNLENGKVEEFEPFGPLMMASIGPLHRTIESRSLIIRMDRRAQSTEDPKKIDRNAFLDWRRQIAQWCADYKEAIQATLLNQPPLLRGRNWDKWQGLLQIGQQLGFLEKFSDAAFQLCKGDYGKEDKSLYALALIRRIFSYQFVSRDGNGQIIGPKRVPEASEWLTVGFLTARLNEDKLAPWAGEDRDSYLSQKGLAELLKNFGIRSERLSRTEHDKQPQAYRYGMFKEAFQRYLGPEDSEPPPWGPVSGPSNTPPDNPSDTPTNGTEEDIFQPLTQTSKHPPQQDLTPSNSTRFAEEDSFKTDAEKIYPPQQKLLTINDLTQGEEDVSINEERVKIFSSGPFAIDVETAAEPQVARRGTPPKTQISEDALSPRKAELRVISVADPTGAVTVHDLKTGPLPDSLREAIATRPLVSHGALFDLAMLQAHGFKTSAEVFCTLTASRLLTAGLRDSNELGPVIERHLGVNLPKELGASDFGGMFLTPAQLAYCANDVRYLGALRERLGAELAKRDDGVDLVRVAGLEMALLRFVVDMRLKGIRVDRGRLETVLGRQATREKELAAELRNDFRLPKLNLQSPDQLLKAFEGVQVFLENTNKETLSEHPHELAAKLLKYRKAAGLLSTLQSCLESLDSENRLYPPLNPLSADTGRFGCRKPNLLAIPRGKEVRGCFIPDDPELVFVEADYANIELRIAAFFAREERLLEVFRHGGDVHIETATRVLGDPAAKQPAKTVNFGCLYGGGWERLKITARTEFGLEFSDDQAQCYHTGFFQAYPNLRKWHRAAKEQASEITYGATAYGRRRWANPDDRADRWDWNRFQLAINFEVQGTGADALKIALVNLGRYLGHGDGTRVVLPVHDSALIQCPRDEADAVAECTRRTMAEAFYEILGKDFPVKVDTKIFTSWGG